MHLLVKNCKLYNFCGNGFIVLKEISLFNITMSKVSECISPSTVLLKELAKLWTFFFNSLLSEKLDDSVVVCF